MDKKNDDGYITTPELCEWLKISKSTASKWRSEGMPYTGKTRAYRYKKKDVLKWFETEKNK